MQRQGSFSQTEYAGVFADAGYTGGDKRPKLEDCDVDWNTAINRAGKPEQVRLAFQNYFTDTQSFARLLEEDCQTLTRREPYYFDFSSNEHIIQEEDE
jgi:hypothetical protein